MLKINSTVFMFIIELLFVLAGIAVFLFFKYRKQAKECITFQEKIVYLENTAKETENIVREKSEESSSVQDAFDALKKKFTLLRQINIKLKQTLTTLIPDAEKSWPLKRTVLPILPR